LREEYGKHQGQSDGQHPGQVPSGFSPTSHYSSHFTPASHWTRRPPHGKRYPRPQASTISRITILQDPIMKRIGSEEWRTSKGTKRNY
jgi:hypothetical protein